MKDTEKEKELQEKFGLSIKEAEEVVRIVNTMAGDQPLEKESWLIRFDREFPSVEIPSPMTYERVLEWQTGRDKSIKSFFREVLEDYKAELIEDIDAWEKGMNAAAFVEKEIGGSPDFAKGAATALAGIKAIISPPNNS